MAAASPREVSSPSPAATGPLRGRVRPWLRAALLENVAIKFLSLVLAVTVFLVVNTDKDREIRVTVPLKYNYPRDTHVLASEEIPEITLTIKGPWRRLRGFNERAIGRVELDLLRTPSGEVSITADRISLPAGLEVTSITPRAVRVAFERLVDRTVEVRPVVTGTPARGHVVGAVRVVPATLRVRGGERKLASVSAIATHEVSAAGAETAFEESIDLDPPAGIAVDPGVRVRVQVEIDDELVTRKLSAIPVGIRTEGGIDAARWAAAPEAVAVTLTGALLAVEQASRELAVFVRVTPGDARPRVAEVEIAGIPPGVGKKVAPATVRLVAVRPR